MREQTGVEFCKPTPVKKEKKKLLETSVCFFFGVLIIILFNKYSLNATIH